MNIEHISIRRKNQANLKAICSVNFDNILVVHGIRLVDGKDGLFLSFPAVIRDDKFLDIVHPIDTDFRKQITKAIIDKYNETPDQEDI